MKDWTTAWLPVWAHPRAPLVALAIRRGSRWDVRIHRWSRLALQALSSLYAVVLLYLPAVVLIIAAGRQLVSLVLFVVVAVLGPVLGLTAELLYMRLWFRLPADTSEMIAGEIERRTWDIIRSTPYPRHQLILSKLAALAWMHGPALGYIAAARLVVLIGVFGQRAIETQPALHISLLDGAVWGAALWLMPWAEALAMTGLGLMVSALCRTRRQASLLSLLSQAGLRLVGMAILFVFFVDVSRLAVVPALLFPQWFFMPFWEGVTYSPQLVAGLWAGLVIWPLVVGIGALVVAVRCINDQ